MARLIGRIASRMRLGASHGWGISKGRGTAPPVVLGQYFGNRYFGARYFGDRYFG